MPSDTSIEWLTIISGFSLLCFGIYVMLFGIRQQLVFLASIQLVLTTGLWVRERSPDLYPLD